MKIKGEIELFINEDGEHANMILRFVSPISEEIRDWIEFAYCNDLVWRVHGHGGRSDNISGEEVWISTVDRALYLHLFKHIKEKQYIVPGSE
jgi:hypothetical protein